MTLNGDPVRIRELPARVERGEITPLDAAIILKRHHDEMETAMKKLRPLILEEALSIHADEGVVPYKNYHLYLEMKQEWVFENDPEWVAANNRLNALEMLLREGHDNNEERAAVIGKPIPNMRIFLHGIPTKYKGYVRK